MKKVERYETTNGRLFEDANKAEAHEVFLLEVKAIEKMLPALPKNDGCSFANGDGYIQHTRESFNAYKAAVLRLGGKHCHKEMTKWAKTPDEVANMGIAGRYFDDGNRDLYRLWNRVMCTDADFKEWGQPYYALNPGKGTLKKIA